MNEATKFEESGGTTEMAEMNKWSKSKELCTYDE